MSQSALQLIRKCLETQETYLDLSSCGLTDSDFADQSQVGAELGKCTHLRSLIISKSNIYQRPQQADDEAGSSRNYFSYLGDLTELSMLTIYGDYSDILRVSDMSFVANLVNLTYLYISFTQIEEIKGLDKLKKLQELNLPYNKIGEIKNLDNLADLQRLNISNNQISKITGLNHLSNLTKLFLNNNDILELGGMDRLKVLQELHISNNQLKSTKGLDALVSLRCLNVSRNDIQELTELDDLDSLLTLDVSYNKITDLKPLFPMLNRLKRTSKMDPANKEKSETGQIIVNNNPVYRPPYEIVSQGAEAILNYLKELDIQGEHYLYEAKMLIVGQPRSGKTSLRHKLFDSASKLPEEDKTTRGIDIDRLNFTIIDKQGKRQKFYYSVWDFGGQQIYQTTHQFFLTQRSLYVLVMDTGKDNIGSDDATINYWLQAVELLGANSPLLLVQNEKNDRQITIDLPQKQSRFPFLKKKYTVDLNALIPQTLSFSKKRLQEFEDLKDDIENELKHLPLIGFPMPKNWLKIREALQDTSKTYPYITRQEYIDLCRKFKITEFERQMELSRIFHDLGIFLHFQESPSTL
jgi:internalin A